MFYVGQKVVCIDASMHTDDWNAGIKRQINLDGLTKGKIYTIRNLIINEGNPRLSPILIQLEEIIRRKIFNWEGIVREAAYHSDRFKPLIEKTTDISIFQKILLDTRSRIPENA